MTGASSDEAGTAQPGADDTAAPLERLQALKESGAITEPEFEKAKAKLLGNG
jgi:membrane protease subunit (stomatin/prohibitin family)